MRAETPRLDFGNKENKQIYMPASLVGSYIKACAPPGVQNYSGRNTVEFSRSVKWVLIADSKKESCPPPPSSAGSKRCPLGIVALQRAAGAPDHGGQRPRLCPDVSRIAAIIPIKSKSTSRLFFAALLRLNALALILKCPNSLKGKVEEIWIH